MKYIDHQPIPGSEHPLIHQLPAASDADPNAEYEVTLCLRPGNDSLSLPELNDLASPDWQAYSQKDLINAFAASTEDLEKVQDFATEYCLEAAHIDLNARIVNLSGKVSDLNAAFKVTLQHFEHTTGSIRGHQGPVYLPAQLTEVVEGVLGLHDLPLSRNPRKSKKANGYVPVVSAHPPFVSFHKGKAEAVQDDAITPHSDGFLNGFTGNQYAELYNFPTEADGLGQTVGILELGGGYTDAQMSTYFLKIGVSKPAIISQTVGKGVNSPGTGGPDSEVALDIQIAGAAAPGAKYIVYFAPNSTAGFIQGIKAMVYDTSFKPEVLSISWGQTESLWTANEVSLFNGALQEAAAIKRSVFASSGDHGSTDGVKDGKQHVQFPASSPYVTGCGGTSISINNGAISQEVVWNSLGNGAEATGGGFSDLFTSVPVYQQGVIPAGVNPSGHRGIPDVAASADGWTYGFYIYYDNKYKVTSGTSGVAPLWAALFARINQKLGPQGFLNTSLYKLAGNTSVFRPITQGNNGAYKAGTPWNPCTGLGTPHGTNLMDALQHS